MGKSRKQKKAEERAAREAKQKGNKKKKNPETAMSQAMENAQTKETFSGSHVIGFALRGKGVLLHAIVRSIGGLSIACDSRVDISGESLNVRSVESMIDSKEPVCTKCLKKQIVKDELANIGQEEKPKEEKPEEKPKEEKTSDNSLKSPGTGKEAPKVEKPPVKVKKKKSQGKKKTAPKTAPAPAENKKEDNWEAISDYVHAVITNRFKVLSQRLEKKIAEIVLEQVQEVINQRPDFYIVSKSNGQYQIIHEPSRYVISDNLDAEGAEYLLSKYLTILEKWNGSSKPPKGWLSAVREIYEQWKQVKVEKPTKLSIRRKKDKPKDKATLSIRRKSSSPKKSGLKIRRGAGKGRR